MKTNRIKDALPRLSDYLHIWASRGPERPALIYQDERTSYGELEERAEALACWLLSQGLEKGDRVAYSMAGTPSFFYVLMAASMAGAIAVGIGTRLKASEIIPILDNSRPKVVFVVDTHEDVLTQAIGAVGCRPLVVPVGGSRPMSAFTACLASKTAALFHRLAEREERVGPDDGLLMVYTSGTTGRPKGALLTHRNVVSSALIQADEFGPPDGCTPDDVFQHQVPVDHVSGAVEWGATPIVAGCTSILNGGFDARTILENTQRYRATILAGVPAMWRLMFGLPEFSSYDLSSVRFCMTGASPATADILERMLAITPVCSNPYGMTETSGFCSYSDIGAGLEHLVSTVGRIAPELDLKIVDEKRNPVRPGEIGQLVYRGPSVISSYYRMPEATGEAIDEDGFFYSGDLGRLDSRGCLELKGRCVEMFITGGYNVYPAEIEAALLACPGVRMTAVLPIPHKLLGEVGRGYIVAEPGAELNGGMLRAQLERVLADYKVPRDYVFRDSLPVTPLGKPQKRALVAEIQKEFDLAEGLT